MKNLLKQSKNILKIKKIKNSPPTELKHRRGTLFTNLIDFFKSLVGELDFYELVGKYILPIRPDRADKRKMRAKTFVSFIYRVA